MKHPVKSTFPNTAVPLSFQLLPPGQRCSVCLVFVNRLLLLATFITLSGCMRQDYRFLGHMLQTDLMSAQAIDPLGPEIADGMQESRAVMWAKADLGDTWR